MLAARSSCTGRPGRVVMEPEDALWLHAQAAQGNHEIDGTYKAVVDVFAVDRTSPPSSVELPSHRGKGFTMKNKIQKQTRGRDTR